MPEHAERRPVVILGAAGSGKTTMLVDRFAELVAAGEAPESILLLTPTGAAADALRVRIEDRLADRGFAELPVRSFPDLCARLLHDEALEAGLDPFFVTATIADRQAMLLERVDELVLRHHDFRGSPATMLGAVIARIDRCKELGLTPEDLAALPDEREREFAALFEAHDRMLWQQGMLDPGELVLRAGALLARRPGVRGRTTARWRHVLVDQLEDATPAQVRLAVALAADHGSLVVAAGEHEGVRGGGAQNVVAVCEALPHAEVVHLDGSRRCPAPIARAAAAAVGDDRWRDPLNRSEDPADDPAREGEVAFWRCSNERAQAQAVAAHIERLVRGGADPAAIGVLVRSVRHEGQALAGALEERAIPYRLVGAAAFFQRAEVRDVLAWLRLLVNPGDAGAVVRALARPPVELRSVDLARCIQIARRRKLDMVGALVAATESPQLDPAARERVLGFLKLHRAASGALDTQRPDLFVHRLIDRLGLRRQQLFAAQSDVVERLVALAHLGELAAAFVRRRPQATPRELARWLVAVAEAGGAEDEAPDDLPRAGATGTVAVASMADGKGLELDHVFVVGLQSSRMPGARRRLVEPIPAELLAPGVEPDSREAHAREMRRLLHVAMTRARKSLVLAFAARSDQDALQQPSPFAEEARAALGAEWEDIEEELFGPDEALHALFTELRDELLGSVQRTGARLGELRLDTELDVAHGVTRYLELLKLAALLARPEGQEVADALPGVNAAIGQAATAMQRDILHSSSLDDVLLAAERDARTRAAATTARDEPSLEAFLPRRGEGLALSASDIETYRTCPLKYKFARVFRIPQEPTLNQRFGIVVHQVLERYHASGGRSVDELLGLLDAGWRRGGFGTGDEEQQLRGKAERSLRRYHERFAEDDAQPIWFEKPFQFKMGAHVLRGRVDRVDRLPGGDYELIDYKTGRPKSAAQLREDVQLSLYAVAAREAWQLESSSQAYLYVLDDEKVPLPAEAVDASWIAETVLEVADGILGQGFEPTPSYAACSFCDYRIVCPAAER